MFQYDWHPDDDPYDEADDDSTDNDIPFDTVFRLDRQTGGIRAVELADAREEAMLTRFYPWHWLGLLASQQILETPDALFATDFFRLERLRAAEAVGTSKSAPALSRVSVVVVESLPDGSSRTLCSTSKRPAVEAAWNAAMGIRSTKTVRLPRALVRPARRPSCRKNGRNGRRAAVRVAQRGTPHSTNRPAASAPSLGAGTTAGRASR